MIGSIVLHYRITEKLGQGGMGTVWKAEDVRLGRPVALKVLAEGVAADTSGIRRFEAEARLASSLNNPHIVAIYDVGEVEGRRFIAMEFVEGGSLRRRLDMRRLRIREVIDLGLGMAEALAAAHRAGVVHRDVKPDNVLVSRDGRAKLADFGIAKLRQPASGTLSMAEGGTAAGTILGSPHYMSPEQALGEELDQRSDVFSFAATLYEMATGRRPFEGRSVADTLRKILGEQPQAPTLIDPAVLPALEDVILKGLEKSPDLRYQHMEEVVSDLRRLRRDAETGRLEAQPRPLARMAQPAVLAMAATALISAAISGLLVYWLMGRQPAPAVGPVAMELLRITALPGLEDEPSWSPDGRSVVYTSNEGGHLGLWIRQPSGGRALRVGTEGVDEGQPTWSPDGSRIAFVSTRNRGGRFGILFGSRAIEMYVNGQNGDLYVMPALGGAATKVAENAYDPAWSPDGKTLAFRSIRDGAWRLWTVSLDEGRIEPVKGVEPRALGPAWSPDGRWLAYVAGASPATGWDLYAVPVIGGRPVPLTEDRATIVLRPTWSRDGRSIVFSSNRGGPLNLWRVSFRAESPGPAGPPERLTTGVGEDVNASASADGTAIAYASVHTAPDIWKVEVDTAELNRLTLETTAEDYPRLAPDGRRLLFYSDRSGRNEVWMLDLVSKELSQVSRGGGGQNAWAPDGRRVAYATSAGLRVVDLESPAILTLAPEISANYPAFSPDGAQICFQGWRDNKYRLYRVAAGGGEPALVETPEGEPGNPSWSLDGRTIYYQSDHLAQRNIWAVELDKGGSRQVTAGNVDDAHPAVSPDGRRLAFLRNHKQLLVQPLGGGSPKLVWEVKEHNRLIEFPSWTPDGRGLVFSLAEKTGDVFSLQVTKPRSGG